MGRTPPLVFANDWAAFLVALLSNATLIICIQIRTPKFLEAYARLLKIHAISDLVNCVVAFAACVQCIPITDRFYYVSYTAGNPTMARIAVLLYHWIVIFVPILQVTLDFIYRFVLICYGKILPGRVLLGLVALANALSWLWAQLFTYGCVRFEDEELTAVERADIQKALGAFPDEMPAYGVSEKASTGTVTSFMVCNVIMAVEYSFIIFVVATISKKVRIETMRSRETKRHQQITKVMLLQASTPLLLCIPTFVNLTASMFGVDEPLIGQLCSGCVAWLAALRPIAAISIIPHYRQLIFGSVTFSDSELTTPRTLLLRPISLTLSPRSPKQKRKERKPKRSASWAPRDVNGPATVL